MEPSSCSLVQEQSELCKSAGRLKVTVQNRIFTLDKTIAAERCEYFRALLQSGMMECRQEEVQLQCVGVQGFLVLLQVLDGAQPMLNSDQIVEAIECTAFLQVPALTNHLVNIINSKNCLLMYDTAVTYGVWELAHRSALFIRDISNDLGEQIGSLPTKLVEYINSLLPSSYIAMCSHSPSTEVLHDVQRTVCYLDEEQKDWRVLTHLPLTASTTKAGVTVFNNKLYIIGGVHDLSNNVVETGFCYDPVVNLWSTVRSTLQLRYNLTLIGNKGCLYAVGGEYNMKPLSAVERYVVSDGTWSFVSPLPYPAASVVSAVAMSRIFICLWKGQGTTNIFEYRPEVDCWTLVTTLIRQHSYGHCMVAHEDNLYVMRNRPCDDFLVCVMDCYNLSSGQWTVVSGQYGNSKGSLFTAVVRGDSVFTLSRHVTTEYTIENHKWKLRRELKGFERIGSIYTFLMRLPKVCVPLREIDPYVSQEKNLLDIRVHPKLSFQTSSDL